MSARRLAFAGLFLWIGTASAGANDRALERAVDAARTSAVLPADVIDWAVAGCATALCFAEGLAFALPGQVRLEQVQHPDTDSIRWAKTTPSLSVDLKGNRLRLALSHFGRKAVTELRAALASGGQVVELDLRGNQGGDVERMLAVAGLLIGPVRDAVTIRHVDRLERLSLDGPADRAWHVTRVMTDQRTASAAVILAALLQIHARAEVLGPAPVTEPVVLKRRLTIDHDWRLILPMAEISVTAP